MLEPMLLMQQPSSAAMKINNKRVGNMDDLTVDDLGGFIDTPAKSYKKKPVTGIARAKTQTIKPVKVTNMNKEQFKKAKSAHKAEIAKLKDQRAKIKSDIKKHKLLIKQAKLVYKISKMKAEAK